MRACVCAVAALLTCAVAGARAGTLAPASATELTRLAGSEDVTVCIELDKCYCDVHDPGDCNGIVGGPYCTRCDQLLVPGDEGGNCEHEEVSVRSLVAYTRGHKKVRQTDADGNSQLVWVGCDNDNVCTVCCNLIYDIEELPPPPFPPDPVGNGPPGFEDQYRFRDVEHWDGLGCECGEHACGAPDD